MEAHHSFVPQPPSKCTCMYGYFGTKNDDNCRTWREVNGGFSNSKITLNNRVHPRQGRWIPHHIGALERKGLRIVRPLPNFLCPFPKTTHASWLRLNHGRNQEKKKNQMGISLALLDLFYHIYIYIFKFSSFI